MKKKISYLITVIMIASQCACGQTKSSISPEVADSSFTNSDTVNSVDSGGPTDSVPIQTKDGQQKEITIAVSPPDGWEPVEGSVLSVQYMKNTASFMVKEEPFTSSTLDDVVDEASEIYKNTFDDFAVLGDAESITIDNKEAKKLTFTCVVSNITMKFCYVYLFVEGKTYVITFGDFSESFDSLSSDYETILSNIKFITQ